MKVLEYEHTQKQCIREEQADGVTLGQAEGESRKKDHTDAERQIMTLGVSSGGTADDDFGFSDDEAEDVTFQVDSAEEARVARAAELRKQAPVAFSEYINYSRIQLTAERGWDQYLPQDPTVEAPVIPQDPAAEAPVTGS